MMDEPRPPYATEPEGPTIADYCDAIDAIDFHLREACRHLGKATALVKESREMLSLWKKTNNDNIAAMVKTLDEFHDSFETEDDRPSYQYAGRPGLMDSALLMRGRK